MKELTLDSFQLERIFCSKCDSFQWHVRKSDGGWECLGCRVRGLSSNPTSTLPEPYQTEVRKELRKIPTWKLREAYDKLKAGEATGIELVEQNRAQAISAMGEILWERGKLETGDMAKDLPSRKQIEDKRAMQEASRIKMPRLRDIEEKSGGMLPMSPEEGPPLPRRFGVKWPWKK